MLNWPDKPFSEDLRKNKLMKGMEKYPKRLRAAYKD